MNAFVIDTFEFSRLKERREGERAVADFARLPEELADASGVVRWSLQGGMHASGHPQLTLSVSATVQLMCQRCLLPFAFEVASESVLVIAKNEAVADEIDAMLSDDSIDVIVGDKAMNFLELLEDEALLTIPLSPKHAVCPDQVGQDVEAAASVKRASPFEVLKNKQ
ncbi:MAG TPA: YceD family protein [Burkholderiaceae bacterium]|jgi:uncharacterized protein|nr:YceD family protein [Burkholderiaceae bacterium]